ncbi:hypothetical protein [Zunongwangia sp. HGR-M22]|uniref:hypothetical protein n=1 Tax=Zunongwangia sp. HGR-M22 TaxID=3015168 RepID=UPI0022DD7213|nr:hypothetical protein [Zunongwangia sp. HGR-M22]WBL26755.1 hypothetical protein PBT91_05690 [Zunongwangia sp. HGR-M22]
MTKTFHVIADEAKFTKDMLASGVTQLGKANYGQKGIYFQAFTSLSTGLERLGKLCLILDYYIINNGDFPSENYVKNKIGHELSLLFDKSESIIINHDIVFEFQKELDDVIHSRIISILTKFAMGDRYSNINYLVKSKFQSDPIKQWSENVDKLIFDKRVSTKKKEQIRENAKISDILIGQFSLVKHFDESRNEISDIETASYLTGMTESITKYRQLYVLQIIRYWVEILFKLQYKAMALNKGDIPYMSEIFAIFYSSDSYFKTRKTYEKN